ncbi:MAG: ion transporter [Lachnospiraceae bacterium]|nr:ion transporter [Lachnospiraceae bacterium]MBP5701841.1 ion transporter [Lachnospiraceae bacterium]
MGKNKNSKQKTDLGKRIFEIIQIGSRSDIPSFLFDALLITIVILNILSLILESFEQLSFMAGVFNVIDIVSIVFFLIEYVLRIATANYLYPEDSRPVSVWKFVSSLDGVIELLTILPFYYLSGFVVFRLLRVARILRLFKINSTYDSFHVILSVFKDKLSQIMSSVLIILILMLSSSICMYSVEHEVQPDVFSNALSGMWWAATTIFTVGYGDMAPVTLMGKVIGIIIDFLAMAVVAIPTGIISAGFVEKYTAIRRNQAKGEERAGLITITVGPDTPYVNKNIGYVEEKESTDILVLIRDGVNAVPTRNIILKSGDILVCRRTS